MIIHVRRKGGGSGELVGVRDEVCLHHPDEADVPLREPGLVLGRERRAVEALVVNLDLGDAGALAGGLHPDLGEVRPELRAHRAALQHLRPHHARRGVQRHHAALERLVLTQRCEKRPAGGILRAGAHAWWRNK
uniref:Uncharacterized protein n=1 Tax=Zea mays TaxID=4577 RepID=B8A101_MAIZE|nr:unknown [Zea mays]